MNSPPLHQAVQQAVEAVPREPTYDWKAIAEHYEAALRHLAENAFASKDWQFARAALNAGTTTAKLAASPALQQQEVPTCLECGDGFTAHDPGICGCCYAMKYRDGRQEVPSEPVQPHTALLEQALSAMAEVQEQAEPGFAPDVAIIPAEDWRVFVDAHAELSMLWTAWRDSPGWEPLAASPSTTEKPVSSEMLRQCAASGQMDSAQIHAHEVAGEMGVDSESVKAPCLTCAANHYCPTHNPAPGVALPPLSAPREAVLERLRSLAAMHAEHGNPNMAACFGEAADLLATAYGVPASRVLPHPGSPEASAMLDSLLAEYNWPANPKNAARAGWEAAERWLRTPGVPVDHQQVTPEHPPMPGGKK